MNTLLALLIAASATLNPIPSHIARPAETVKIESAVTVTAPITTLSFDKSTVTTTAAPIPTAEDIITTPPLTESPSYNGVATQPLYLTPAPTVQPVKKGIPNQTPAPQVKNPDVAVGPNTPLPTVTQPPAIDAPFTFAGHEDACMGWKLKMDQFNLTSGKYKMTLPLKPGEMTILCSNN